MNFFIYCGNALTAKAPPLKHSLNMGEQLQDRKDLPATGNDLIQLADRIDSNFSQVRTQFNILESKIDKLPGRISRQIFAAVASFTGIIAAVVAVTIQAMN